MADVPLSGITGGGGLLATAAYSGDTIPTGTSANITVSCPLNKFLRLTLLYADANQSGITITFGSRVIASAKALSQPSNFAVNNINIGNAGDTNGDNGSALPFITGKRNEDLIFSFASATGTNIRYCYEVLEDA